MTMTLIDLLKEHEQDFEFYPTTGAILASLAPFLKSNDFHKNKSMLDIGAGNGKVFKVLESLDISFSEKYGIEKSDILRAQMDKEIFIVGTDFHASTLIDKKVDVIFCNPPYKEFTHGPRKLLKKPTPKIFFWSFPSAGKTARKSPMHLKTEKQAPAFYPAMTF